jgi:hypothetical protein
MLKIIKPEFPIHALFKLASYVMEKALCIIEEKPLNII